MTADSKDQAEGEYFDVILEDVETGIRPRKMKAADKSVADKSGGWQFASLAGQIGFDIALPMVLGLVVGVKLDERWGTKPNATLILFAVGLMISCASLIRIVKDALDRR